MTEFFPTDDTRARWLGIGVVRVPHVPDTVYPPSHIKTEPSCHQCRRLASTRRPDWFANEPTALSSCWPGCPTTWLGDEGGGRGRGVRVQDSRRRTSVAKCVYRARVTVIQAVVILTSPRTGLLLQYCSMYIGIATFRRGAIPIFWLFIRNRNNASLFSKENRRLW